MENKKLLKVLLTVLTIASVIGIPILVGPEKLNDGEKTGIFLEWAIGLLYMVGITVVGCIVWYIFSSVYDLWDDIID